MTRMLISLEESDKQWLAQSARKAGASMSEIVRRAIHQAQESEQKPMKDLLAWTKGLWKHGDGLKYQRRIRKEWR